MKFEGRREDDRLLTGRGRYTADWNLPGQRYGAFLRSDLLFEVGEMLVMEFDLPGGRHIRTQGRVVRVARGGAKDRFPGMGLEFIDLSPDDRAAIARLT